MVNPLISVVMPIYNPTEYLPEAIESIIHQTFPHFEFIIISDDSSEKTRAILDDYQTRDKRIHVYHQQRTGLVSSLNRGFHLAKGKYIARMDGDDISLPGRFEKQYNYLEKHPETGICGTWMEYTDEHGTTLHRPKTPASHNLLAWQIFFSSPFDHPTVMIRKDIVEKAGFYHPEKKYAEDYDLWTRLFFITKFANIPEFLVKYRSHSHNISSVHATDMATMSDRIKLELIENFLPKEQLQGVEPDKIQNLWNPAVLGTAQIKEQVRLLHLLHLNFLRKFHLTKTEKREVSHDIITRYVRYAYHSSQKSKFLSLVICCNACKISPKIFFDQIIIFLRAKITFRAKHVP
jgi:glycosyltransferase involved in cell wall biosynthesis